MKRKGTFLFVLFLVLILVLLVTINLSFGRAYITSLSESTTLLFSGLLIALMILAFVFREVENSRVQNEFITIITHKFRTPLTGIRWTIDMLQKDITLLEKKDLLIEMEKANNRLMEIVDLLVGFAKFDKRLVYAFEAISLGEIVSTAFSKYSAAIKSKNIQISISSDKNLPMIIIDKAKIQFVVDMLVDNATKYTPKDGFISASFEASNKDITLKIKDSGIGIGFFDRRRVFSHFFRAKSAQLMDANGLGLGLYTAKNIVERHNGKLWVESEGLNKGSSFFVRLPIKR